MALMLNIVGVMQKNLAEIKVSAKCLLALLFWEEKLISSSERVNRDQNMFILQ